MPTRNNIRLTLMDAKIMLEGVEKKAAETGVPMDIAVVDDGGNLLAFHRMEGAKITSIDVAISKAYTAAAARTPTHKYGEIAQPGGPAFGIFVSNQGRFMIVGGGLPILIEGQVVGGIGVSSGTADQDREVAQAGIDTLLRSLSS
ncbi:MAG: heme-binding protein [Candidatus Methylomirabilales bacterium]